MIVKQKKINKIITCLSIVCLLSLCIATVYGVGTTPTLVNKLNTALKRIQEYLVKMSTPAAGVAIAAGVFMRKFSFGNEEKMILGKKVIVNAIVCYGIILSIDLILKFIDTVLD